MVVGVFPALKLGVLFIKQISKPIAKLLVTQAKNHPVFRTYFIIPPAQFYHWAEVKAKMYVMNLGKPTKVAKLNEAMAIELGANLVGEMFIFSVAGGCLILEYNRQVAKETKKEEIRVQQVQKFTDDIQSLMETTRIQEAEIDYLNKTIVDLAKKSKIQLPEKPVFKRIETISTESENKEDVKLSLVQQALAFLKKDEAKNDKLS
ncbi:putative OPA3-like protein CG13603 [Leptopilina heterotoma]|uniref:putative OPA3-like protein CG13603 n=1 Tax=Leptopilina heterotoma TaxID=63436 RepID=UPI001CA9A159|nr:putative OPA3-like protein CG13603 [Leptopilina heterotoma]